MRVSYYGFLILSVYKCFFNMLLWKVLFVEVLFIPENWFLSKKLIFPLLMTLYDSIYILITIPLLSLYFFVSS